MSIARERAVENWEQIFVSLVLGLGFVAMFAGFNYFFLIWILGFAVVMPIVSVLAGEEDDSDSNWRNDGTSSEQHHEEPATETDTTDALSTLRDRYARGDLTDEQFERKLDALLETEQPETAAEWRARNGEREREPERT